MLQVLDKGQILQAGKYDELLQAGTNFTALVEAHNEAIDSMDVSDNFGDDHVMEIMPDECFLDRMENHHVGDEVHKLQKQMHSQKSSLLICANKPARGRSLNWILMTKIANSLWKKQERKVM